MLIAHLPLHNRLTRRLFGLPAADALPLRLTARRIYILPTRAGLIFLALWVGMLLGSVNYALAMGYLYTFLLLGLLLTALFATWRNLAGLNLLAVESEPAFAGDALRFTFRLANPHRRVRLAIGVAVDGASTVLASVPAAGQASVVLRPLARSRGRQPLGVVRIYSEYPLGLFHAWALLKLNIAGIVWPRPAGSHALPPDAGREASAGTHAGGGTEDFDGLRAYEQGMPPARIVWKSLARQGEPLAKAFVTPLAHALWLDWEVLAGLPPEARLSQLARWVLAADRTGKPYGLRLPGQCIAPGTGLAHRHRCLNALALMPPSHAEDAKSKRATHGKPERA